MCHTLGNDVLLPLEPFKRDATCTVIAVIISILCGVDRRLLRGRELLCIWGTTNTNGLKIIFGGITGYTCC
jgi:hypothetical protein